MRNSHASRVLPMPAGPITDTRRARPSRPVAWNSSLSRRSSSSRPTNGASSVSDRFRPPRSATTRSARHAGTGAALPLSVCSPAGSKAIAFEAARCVASPTRTEPGGATDWRRDAVFTRSPATMPCPTAPIMTAASPVSTPARASIPGPSALTAWTSSSPARTARSASSSCAVGAPQTAITASPMNFSTVPPYRAITSDARSKYRPSTARTSSASRSSAKGVNPTRSANRIDTTRRSVDGPGRAADPAAAEPPYVGPGVVAPVCPALAGRAAAQSPQKASPGSFGAPHAGQATARGAAHRAQNLRPGRFSAPHREQVMPGTPSCVRGTVTHGTPDRYWLDPGPARAEPARSHTERLLSLPASPSRRSRRRTAARTTG